MRGVRCPRRLGSKHRIPDRGRGLVFEAQPTQGELVLVDTTEQFDAGDGGGGGLEALEAKHVSCSALNSAMVLFDEVVEIL